ncbi:MAG: NfeD family protein [bacterium]|nr:NfeD family protein [bacterium]
MPWWGWITVGALLLVAEIAIVDLEFYLVFLGASALLTGLVMLGGATLPIWGQWLLFAALATASFGFFRKALYTRLRPPPDGEIREGLAGDRGVASEAIAAGARGSIMLRGATWTARNVGDAPIQEGGACVVERTEGLVVDVRAE